MKSELENRCHNIQSELYPLSGTTIKLLYTCVGWFSSFVVFFVGFLSFCAHSPQPFNCFYPFVQLAQRLLSDIFIYHLFHYCKVTVVLSFVYFPLSFLLDLTLLLPFLDFLFIYF